MTVYANPFPHLGTRWWRDHRRFILRSTEDVEDFAVIDLRRVSGWKPLVYTCFCGDDCPTPVYLVEEYLSLTGLSEKQGTRGKKGGEISNLLDVWMNSESNRGEKLQNLLTNLDSLVEFARENQLLVDPP